MRLTQNTIPLRDVYKRPFAVIFFFLFGFPIRIAFVHPFCDYLTSSNVRKNMKKRWPRF